MGKLIAAYGLVTRNGGGWVVVQVGECLIWSGGVVREQRDNCWGVGRLTNLSLGLQMDSSKYTRSICKVSARV